MKLKQKAKIVIKNSRERVVCLHFLEEKPRRRKVEGKLKNNNKIKIN